MARKSKSAAEKAKADRLKMMENYEEPEWMKMSNVEEELFRFIGLDMEVKDRK